MDENITDCAIGAGLKLAIGKEGGSRAGRCLCQKVYTLCVVTTNGLGANGLDVWVCESADCRASNTDESLDVGNCTCFTFLFVQTIHGNILNWREGTRNVEEVRRISAQRRSYSGL